MIRDESHWQLTAQLITVVAISLNIANVVGYTKCQKDAASKIQSMAGQYIGQALLQQAVSRIPGFGGAAEEGGAAAPSNNPSGGNSSLPSWAK